MKHKTPIAPSKGRNENTRKEKKISSNSKVQFPSPGGVKGGYLPMKIKDVVIINQTWRINYFWRVEQIPTTPGPSKGGELEHR